MRTRPTLVAILIAALLGLAASATAGAYPRSAAIDEGALRLDGKPVFLFTGDYPYYRDDPASWSRKLDLMKAAGMDVVTFYVPWRHHQPRQDMAPDFTGATQPNRDVLRFVRLIREKGMLAVAKPGPFIHAELNYGGLPDWVNPTRNPAIKPDADALGGPTAWLITREVLPDFFDPEFRRLTDRWMRAVGDAVIRPSQVPRGPIAAVQVLNERIYSDFATVAAFGFFTAGGITSSGYSQPRIADWGRGEPPRAWSRPQGLAGAERFVSWALHQGEDYRDAIELGAAGVGPVDVPELINVNPGFNPAKFPNTPNDVVAANGEDWLLRTEADHLRDRYPRGHTNWVGVVMKDPRAYLLYVLEATRDRGPNMEENWGFGKLYDPAYVKAQPSVFQSIAYAGWGATGINVYTAVSTDYYDNDPGLDSYRKAGADPSSHSPYPDAAPIRPDNSLHSTYDAVRQLGRLWHRVGPSLMRAQPPRTMAWGIYPPYAAAGAWQPLDADWQALGLVGAPHSVFKGSEGFLSSAIASDTQAGQVHLPTESPKRLGRWKQIVLAGSRWMDGETQRKLVRYVKRGGTLFVTGDLPVLAADLASLDRTLVDALLPGVTLQVRQLEEPIEIDAFGGRRRAAGAVSALTATGSAKVEARLPDGTPVAVSRRVGKGAIVFAGWQPWEAPDHDAAQFAGSSGLAEDVAARIAGAGPEPGDGSPLVEVNTWRDHRRLHVFVINREAKARTVRSAGIGVRVAGHGVAEVMLDHGRLVAAYVDGANDLEPDLSTVPLVRVGRRRVSASGPADLLVLGRRASLAYASPGTVVRQTTSRR